MHYPISFGLMETIPKMRIVQQRDATSINETALDSLREKFTEALSYQAVPERVAALETLVDECAAPLEALETGARLSLEYELFLTTLSRIHLLESTRFRLSQLITT